MTANKKLLLLPGDGIGPEVMARGQARAGLAAGPEARAISRSTEDLVGGASIDAHGVPVTDATRRRAPAADAVLFGSVGGPKWDHAALRHPPRSRPAAPAQGLGAVRQSASGESVRRARRCQLAEARTGARPRHHDRARMHRRHLFRRSARHRDPARRLQARHQHRSLHDARDRARRPRRLRPRPQAPGPRLQRRESQCHGKRPALAPDHDGPAKSRIPGRRADPHVRRQLRHAAGAKTRGSSTSSSPATCLATSSPTSPPC